MKKINKESVKNINDAREWGGWLVECDHGASLDSEQTTYLVHCETAAEVSFHAGATLLFFDEADARNAMECEEFGDVMAALILDGNLPEIGYYDENSYEIIEEEEDEEED